jgi:hypothetical protein
VTQVFEAGIDSARARVRVSDWSPTGYIRWNVGSGCFNRYTVEGVASATDDHGARAIKALSYIRRGGHLVNLDQVHVRLRADLFRFSQERRLAFLAMTAGKTIRRQPAHWRFFTYKYSAPMLGTG